MERFASYCLVDLHTIGSLQGHEDIVVLLTNRISIPVERSEFQDDPLRLKVAIT